jgi:hypothetical protein
MGECHVPLLRGVHEQTQPRSTHEIATHRDEILLGLLSLQRDEI